MFGVKNTIDRAAIMAEGEELRSEDLPEEIMPAYKGRREKRSKPLAMD